MDFLLPPNTLTPQPFFDSNFLRRELISFSKPKTSIPKQLENSTKPLGRHTKSSPFATLPKPTSLGGSTSSFLASNSFLIRINFFLDFNLYISYIYTNSLSTKNRNVPNLILSNPLDYGIVLIISLITKKNNYNISQLHSSTLLLKLVNRSFPFPSWIHLLETLYCLNLW